MYLIGTLEVCPFGDSKHRWQWRLTAVAKKNTKSKRHRLHEHQLQRSVLPSTCLQLRTLLPGLSLSSVTFPCWQDLEQFCALCCSLDVCGATSWLDVVFIFDRSVAVFPNRRYTTLTLIPHPHPPHCWWFHIGLLVEVAFAGLSIVELYFPLQLLSIF